MIEINWRNNTQLWLINNVGRIIATAQSNFQNEHIGRHFGECQQCRGSRRLEMRNLVPFDRCIGAFQPVDQPSVINDLPSKPDAFIEADKVGACKNMHPQTCSFHHRAHEGTGGPFAIRSSDMDNRRKFVLRTAEQVERSQYTPER